MEKKLVKLLAYLSSFVLILLLWGGYAYFIKAPLILPAPSAVVKSAVELVLQSSFWNGIFSTILRVFSAFIISIVIGSLLGFLSTLSEFLDSFFMVPVSIIRVTPVIAVILLALFWFNSGTVPVFVSVLMALPVMYSAVSKGLSQKQSEEMKKKLFMAKVYGLSNYKIYRYIKIPGCKSSFLSGLESAFGLCWKVTVAGEVLSLPKNGCGTFMQISQVHLETAQVMAITILLILISVFMEEAVKLLCNKWRQL